MNDIENGLPDTLEYPVEKFYECNFIISEKLKGWGLVSSVMKMTLILHLTVGSKTLMIRFKNTPTHLKAFLYKKIPVVTI